jgi:hypothetical protein
MTCRPLLSALAALGLASTSIAQLEWEYSGMSEYSYSRAWYCSELAPGVYGASVEQYVVGERSKAHFVQLEDGISTPIPYTSRPGWWIRGVGPTKDVINDRWHFLSIVRDSVTGDQIGLYYSIHSVPGLVANALLLERPSSRS